VISTNLGGIGHTERGETALVVLDEHQTLAAQGLFHRIWGNRAMLFRVCGEHFRREMKTGVAVFSANLGLGKFLPNKMNLGLGGRENTDTMYGPFGKFAELRSKKNLENCFEVLSGPEINSKQQCIDSFAKTVHKYVKKCASCGKHGTSEIAFLASAMSRFFGSRVYQFEWR